MAKKTIKITLHMSEIMYDVQNKTWLAGRSREAGDNYQNVSFMQLDDTDSNTNQALRSIGNAYATLKSKVSEYLDDSASEGDDIQAGKGNIVIALQMPMNYNEATVKALGASMHQYIVNTAVSDWYTLTNKDDAAAYAALAGVNLSEIDEAISKRVRPTREGV